MTSCCSTISFVLPFIKKRGQGGPGRVSQNSRQPRTLIHILDDDSLLNIFSFCRPVAILGESDALDAFQTLVGGEWNRERWWYRVVQVCRRWRYLILQSASHLRLSLVCAPGTPVTDMLAHSPPLPLVIDYLDENNNINAKDEEGLIYALQQRDRLRCIRLVKPVPILKKLIVNLDKEFPILEHLLIWHQLHQRPGTRRSGDLNLPETFRAPHLRHLALRNFTIPIESPLFTTMGNLVNLFFNITPLSSYFHPNALLQWFSLMPQLERLGIGMNSHFPSDDIERQLLRTPITMHATLPSLRSFGFEGPSAYLEALLSRLTTPLLERLLVNFFNQLTHSTPNLQQLVNATGNLRFNNCKLTFTMDNLLVMVYPHKGARAFSFGMALGGKHLDWQVACAAQVFHMLRARISVLEHLTLEYYGHSISSEWNNEADRTRWRELLALFDNLKTLRVDMALVEELSRSLQPIDGESPTELLPELRELSYSGGCSLRCAFAPFVDARRKAGRSMAVIHL